MKNDFFPFLFPSNLLVPYWIYAAINWIQFIKAVRLEDFLCTQSTEAAFAINCSGGNRHHTASTFSKTACKQYILEQSFFNSYLKYQ